MIARDMGGVKLYHACCLSHLMCLVDHVFQRHGYIRIVAHLLTVPNHVSPTNSQLLGFEM